MSDPSNPPQDPYGQPGPHGQTPYGQDPYGLPAYPAGPTYAHWGKRVGAYAIDTLILMAAYLPAIVGSPMLEDPRPRVPAWC